MKNTVVVKPIVYGNVSYYFGKKRESDGHTHKWQIYVKPYYNDDMTKWVRKVSFKLHESYASSTRVLEKPPFQIQETGWGEFECVIKIYFTDPNERIVTFYHPLKLFQLNADAQMLAGKKPVVSEYYDEVVFHDPSKYMYDCLTDSVSKNRSLLRHETDIDHRQDRSLQLIIAAKSQVREEITELKEALKEAQDLIQKFSEDVTKAQSGDAEPSEVKTEPSSPKTQEGADDPQTPMEVSSCRDMGSVV